MYRGLCQIQTLPKRLRELEFAYLWSIPHYATPGTKSALLEAFREIVQAILQDFSVPTAPWDRESVHRRRVYWGRPTFAYPPRPRAWAYARRWLEHEGWLCAPPWLQLRKKGGNYPPLAIFNVVRWQWGRCIHRLDRGLLGRGERRFTSAALSAFGVAMARASSLPLLYDTSTALSIEHVMHRAFMGLIRNSDQLRNTIFVQGNEFWTRQKGYRKRWDAFLDSIYLDRQKSADLSHHAPLE